MVGVAVMMGPFVRPGVGVGEKVRVAEPSGARRWATAGACSAKVTWSMVLAFGAVRMMESPPAESRKLVWISWRVRGAFWKVSLSAQMRR